MAALQKAQADELEARLRLTLGDRAGAMKAAQRLSDDRRLMFSVLVAITTNDAHRAQQLLHASPAHTATIRSDLERKLLHAEIALIPLP